MSDHNDDGYGMPDREEFQHDPPGYAEVRSGVIISELAEQYGYVGIGATDVYKAADVYAEMLVDDGCTASMSLVGAMVLIGVRKVVSNLIRDGHVNALVTTGTNLIHDAIEAIGGEHRHGRAHPDPPSPPPHGSRGHEIEHHGEKTEREHDETLHDEEVDRIYNVCLPREHFVLFESHLRSKIFPALEEEGTVGTADLYRELGRVNSEINDREGVDEDAGVVVAAYEIDVPIYCPAAQDSVLGLQAWMYSQTPSLSLDALVDMTPLAGLAYDTDMAGYLLIGGSAPKNFALQTMLVTPGTYGYGVQITMNPAVTGGLSGTTLDEIRSWGKLERDARDTTTLSDATVMLPLLIAVARERIE